MQRIRDVNEALGISELSWFETSDSIKIPLAV